MQRVAHDVRRAVQLRPCSARSGPAAGPTAAHACVRAVPGRPSPRFSSASCASRSLSSRARFSLSASSRRSLDSLVSERAGGVGDTALPRCVLARVSAESRPCGTEWRAVEARPPRPVGSARPAETSAEGGREARFSIASLVTAVTHPCNSSRPSRAYATRHAPSVVLRTCRISVTRPSGVIRGGLMMHGCSDSIARSTAHLEEMNRGAWRHLARPRAAQVKVSARLQRLRRAHLRGRWPARRRVGSHASRPRGGPRGGWQGCQP